MDSVTVELGQVKPFGENNMNDFIGIVDNLRALGSHQPTQQLALNHERYTIFQIKDEIIKKKYGIYFII
jgi:succinylglutamate desuccinylase